jgi:hypothetical protein
MRSRFHVRAILSASVLTVLGVIAAAPAPEAARSPYPQACGMTFFDRVGDKIYSDNGGAYRDGSLPLGDKTISCQVGGPNSDSVKLLLSIPNAKSTTRRTFRGDYTNPSSSGSPTGTFNDGDYLILEHIALMSVGTSTTAGAHFRFHSGSWFFNWCGLLQGACANYPGSDVVWVTHDARNHWDVTTDAPGGDIAQLQDGGTTLNFYHMPFRLSVDCPGCP